MASLKVLPFFSVALAALLLNSVYGAVNQVPLPTIDLTEWWGPGTKDPNEDTSVTNYAVQFDDAMVSDLKSRLGSHRPFTPPLEGVAFQYGFNSIALETWVQYLIKQYPYQDRQKFLNQYPHFKTKIQGLNIHFMRITSQNTKNVVVPLLLLHGWPGSVREFYEAIPYLLSISEAKGLALDIIVPSLPGFAFSDGAVRPGLGVDKVAVVLRNLMQRLGFTQYCVHGGGMGSMIGSAMATLFSNEVLGFHSTFAFFHTPDILFRMIWGSAHKTEIVSPNLVNRMYPLTTTLFDLMTTIGYLHQLATKPDTVGMVTGDSPSGLMAYTLDKIATGVRKSFIKLQDGGLTKILTAEQIFDNFMLYWSTNCMTTAGRLYAETFNKRYFGLRLNQIRSPVPTYVLQTPDEFVYLPSWMIRLKFPNLLKVVLPSEGGHFYAWEKPKLFAEDVVKAIIAFRDWHTMDSALSTKCQSYIEN